MADLVGQSLGPYMITERIGRGGMADVYKAFHTSLSVYRAIKVIRPEFVTSDDFRARFQKEARAVAQLRHAGIVQVHDFGTHEDAYYMVMEFVEGRDLKKVLTAEGSIRPISRAVRLVLQIARALEYAHERGLIHRDVKPENVMITATEQSILTDFGIAKLVASSSHLTQTGLGIGTPAYMSPEQAQGLTEVGPEADVYALSIVLFELLTGRVPFDADTPVAVILKSIRDPFPMPRAMNPDISEALQAVILRGAAKSPSDRYATIAEFRAALATALEDRPGVAETTMAAAATIQRTDDGASRGTRRGLNALTYVALVALTSAAGIYYWVAREPALPVSQRTATPAAADTPQSAADPAQESAANAKAAQSAAAPSAIDAGVLAFDRPTVGRTEHIGQQVDYTVDGVAGDSIYFDRGHVTAVTRFTLFAPDGARVFETTSDVGPQTLPQGGRYRLVAEPELAAPAEFEFSLWRLTVPVADGGLIKPDVSVEGHTDMPGQVERFEIDGKAGQQLAFVLDQASEVTDFRLLDPDGVREIFATEGDAGPVKLPHTGKYTLLADPRFDKPSQFEFMVRSIATRSDVRVLQPAEQRQTTQGTAPVLVESQTPPSHTSPLQIAATQTTATQTADTHPAQSPQIMAAGEAPSSGSLGNQVIKGVTTQSDLLKRFGGPNLTTIDPQGRDTWVYERSVTQTDTRGATNAASGSADFSAFWSVGQASAGASSTQSASTLSSRSSIHTVTVIVTFAPNRTVLDYTVKANYF